jgi:hypothetical protein
VVVAGLLLLDAGRRHAHVLQAEDHGDRRGDDGTGLWCDEIDLGTRRRGCLAGQGRREGQGGQNSGGSKNSTQGAILSIGSASSSIWCEAHRKARCWGPTDCLGSPAGELIQALQRHPVCSAAA